MKAATPVPMAFCSAQPTEDLKHHFNAEVSRKDLYETYLLAFKACVQGSQGRGSDGSTTRDKWTALLCGSGRTLQNIPRKKWDFKGVTSYQTAGYP